MKRLVYLHANNVCFQLSCKQPIHLALDSEKNLNAPLITCLMGDGHFQAGSVEVNLCQAKEISHCSPRNGAPEGISLKKGLNRAECTECGSTQISYVERMILEKNTGLESSVCYPQTPRSSSWATKHPTWTLCYGEKHSRPREYTSQQVSFQVCHGHSPNRAATQHSGWSVPVLTTSLLKKYLKQEQTVILQVSNESQINLYKYLFDFCDSDWRREHAFMNQGFEKAEHSYSLLVPLFKVFEWSLAPFNLP